MTWQLEQRRHYLLIVLRRLVRPLDLQDLGVLFKQLIALL